MPVLSCFIVCRMIDVNVKITKGDTALMLAARKSLEGTVNLLLYKGAG